MRSFTITLYLISLVSDEVVETITTTVKEDDVGTAVAHLMRNYSFLVASFNCVPVKEKK